MSNTKHKIVTKDDIDEAWNNKMIDSHAIPKIRESCKRKNKYEQVKARAEKLINIFRRR